MRQFLQIKRNGLKKNTKTLMQGPEFKELNVWWNELMIGFPGVTSLSTGADRSYSLTVSHTVPSEDAVVCAYYATMRRDGGSDWQGFYCDRWKDVVR